MSEKQGSGAELADLPQRESKPSPIFTGADGASLRAGHPPTPATGRRLLWSSLFPLRTAGQPGPGAFIPGLSRSRGWRQDGLGRFSKQDALGRGRPGSGAGAACPALSQ